MDNLTKKEKKEKLEQYKHKTVLNVLQNKEDLYKWVLLFLNMKLTKGWIDKDSNSSPIDSIWEVYCAIKNNTGDKIPGYILLSSRDSYKTFSSSVLEVLVMIHFQKSIAHMAAISKQSQKALSYINNFMRKLKPYLDAKGWKPISENKTLISYETPEGRNPYIKVVTCTLAGANSDHVNFFVCDELDVIPNPAAFEESRLIPGVENGCFPITLKLSTRKFAFGIMSKEIENSNKTGEKLLRWNIMDTAERCPESRHRPDLPMDIRFIGKNMPLQSLTEEDFFNKIDATKHGEFSKIECFGGCAKCNLLPVCKTELAKRDKDCTGGFYKPLMAIENLFRGNNPEMIEAQLLCWKPSLKGLVYPRYDSGNVLTIEDAYFFLTGERRSIVTFDMLVNTITSMGIPVFAGMDFGFRHKTSIVVCCKLQNGDFWVLHTFAEAELELDQMVRKCVELKELFNIQKFFCDTAMPAYIKTLKKNGIRCGEFKKDVMGGIESVRGVLCDALGRRRLKIIKTPHNEEVENMFKNHHFLLDPQGNLTKEPDDEEFADTGDALRYLGQNIFSPKGNSVAISKDPTPETERRPEDIPEEERRKLQQSLHQNQFQQELKTLKGDSQDAENTRKSKGGLFWSM